jgi:capsular polysaccharide export protein
LLKATKGVVLVNSTTGLSALGHGAPVKVCGAALYDLPGLTFQGRLHDFWFVAQNAKPDVEILRRFKVALVEKTQLNGSFYRKLPDAPWCCGVWLHGQMAERLWPQPALTAPVKHLPGKQRKRRSKHSGVRAKVPRL